MRPYVPCICNLHPQLQCSDHNVLFARLIVCPLFNDLLASPIITLCVKMICPPPSKPNQICCIWCFFAFQMLLPQISACASFSSKSFARSLSPVTTHVPQGHTALQWTPQAYEQLLLATTGGALPDFTLRGILRPFNGICNDLRFQVSPVGSKPTVIWFICGDILIGTMSKYF